jgi:hypothetical protein
MFTTNLNRDSKSEETQQFLADFAKAYDFPVDMVAASSHDAVMLVVDAMRKNGTTAADVKAQQAAPAAPAATVPDLEPDPALARARQSKQ